ncbi:MAG: type I-U CRISPR-associated protein Cas5/Cas6 [Alphaproteobacteria bacterium]|nr:type I-U CRISPR-associated protein Cas5/Cas6 [Alphaproteobacteria bacterium]
MDGSRSPYVAARWRLAGHNLPALSGAVLVGDLVRRALMSHAAGIGGRDAIPGTLSGHGEGGDRIFFLPEDADRDGRIDHVLLYRAGGFDNVDLRIATSLRRLWAGSFGEWQVVETWVAQRDEPLGSLIRPSRRWESLTPCVCPIHWKNPPLRTLSRLCRDAALPPPSAATPSPDMATRTAGSFAWLRPDQDNRPPDRRGGFWTLTFPEPIRRPVALGFNQFYGLGLFLPGDADAWDASPA